MPTWAARWQTASHPWIACWTDSPSRTSPVTTSTSARTSGSNHSSAPCDSYALYRHSARTRAPDRMSALVRWLPMNPPAPVTSTERPRRSSTIGRRVAPPCRYRARVDRWRVPLADLAIEADDLEAVAAVYRSGWLTTGPRTAAFERAFAEVVDRQEAVAVSSGTAALHLLLLAAGLGPGDEVIVPSLSFVATASAAAYTGAKPVFVDIESRTRPWLSAEASEAAVGPRTAAIVAMPYGGHPGCLPKLADVAGRHELILLEDAAHALGARVSERRVGAFGDGA